MRIKICGITSLEDALIAAEAGADYLGFVFYPPSARSIEVTAARNIIEKLNRQHRCPLLVGVFVNEQAQAIAEVMDGCGLDLAQLSGDEPPYLVGDQASPIFGRCYKTLRPQSYLEAEAEAEWYLPPDLDNPPTRPAILLDSYHPKLPGGTGVVGDWTIGADLSRSVPGLMLAGGLTVDNVALAVQQVQPFAVDVASGVEVRPGKKSHGLIRDFITNARRAVDS